MKGYRGAASGFLAAAVLIGAGCGGPDGVPPETTEMQGITMVSIPAGSFSMGYDYTVSAPGGDRVNRYYPDEQPVHTVTLSAFRIGATEITQARFEAVMGRNPSAVKGGDLPVTDVGANEALEFCNRLSEAAGLDACYDPSTGKCDLSKNGFRLPTEAEWEYACRAGTTTHFSSGDTEADLDRVGWYLGNSGGSPHPVGLKEPNAWGLYDMHGNVWEICCDASDEYDGRYRPGPVADPVFEGNFNFRVNRGGSWFSEPSECRSAVRGKFWTGGGSDHLGFRVAQSIR